MNVRVKAYAKLNLTLDITGLAGGFHMIDSLCCSVDMFDLIKLRSRSDSKVTVTMRGLGFETLPTENNNAYKAAIAYRDKFSTRGADITIFKNIPSGAGLGGSSADVSGVIRGMNKLYGLGSGRELKELADGLGSDTGYMLTGGFARLKGRGEKVEFLDCEKKLYFLLLVPPSGVSTAECYKRCDGFNRRIYGTQNAVDALLKGDVTALGQALSNALYAPAISINPDVERAYNELLSFSPLGVNMTGSGSAVYALFENREMCEWAKSRYKGKFDCLVLKGVIPKI